MNIPGVQLAAAGFDPGAKLSPMLSVGTARCQDIAVPHGSRGARALGVGWGEATLPFSLP